MGKTDKREKYFKYRYSFLKFSISFMKSIARVTDFIPAPRIIPFTHFFFCAFSIVIFLYKITANIARSSVIGVSIIQNSRPPFRSSSLLTKKVDQKGSCTQDIRSVQMIELFMPASFCWVSTILSP